MVTFTVNALPVLTAIPDVTACDTYTLPSLSAGNYFSQSAGTGTAFNAGDIISANQTLYVYAQSGGTPNCVNQDTFAITINTSPIADAPAAVNVCNNYVLPALSSGNTYYTGSAGTGSIVSAGSTITTTQTLYVYAETGTTPNCTDENPFTITIQAGPALNNPGPQTSCDTYTLPAITGSNLTGSESYYSGPNGTGSVIASGTIITADQSVYIYDNNGTCSDNELFTVTINVTPAITNPGAQTACGSYVLPAITGTNLSGSQAYYNDSQTNGGTLISGSVSTSQTIWIYDADGACSDETSFAVTVNPLPTVTSVTGGATYCAGDVVTPINVAVTGTPVWTVSYTLNGIAQTVTGSTSPISLGNTAGVYVVNAIADANCNNSGSFGTQTVTVNPIPGAPLASPDSTYCSSWNLNPLNVTGSGSIFTWYSDATLSTVIGSGSSLQPDFILGSTSYYVTQTILGCEGPADEAIVTINTCDIIVPTAFTPDGDNVNEVWDIVNLDYVYPENQVTVYNRWGGLIYQSEKGKYSSKPWDGTYEGNPLPVASYYFIIDVNNENFQPIKGIVSIVLE